MCLLSHSSYNTAALEAPMLFRCCLRSLLCAMPRDVQCWPISGPRNSSPAQAFPRLKEANPVKKRWATFGVGLFLALLIPVKLTMAAEVKLHIPPVFQEHPSWCWAAVGEMVFKYYYVPAAHRTNYQCGIAQGRKLCIGIPNCLECELPPGDEITMVNMLEQYPVMATRRARSRPPHYR